MSGLLPGMIFRTFTEQETTLLRRIGETVHMVSAPMASIIRGSAHRAPLARECVVQIDYAVQ